MDPNNAHLARIAADAAFERAAHEKTAQVLPETAALLREICDRLAAIEAILVEPKPQG